MALRKRGEAALDDVIDALLKVRGMMADRLDAVDVDKLQRQAAKYASGTVKQGSVYADKLRRTVGLEPRRKTSYGLPIAGAIVLGVVAVGIGLVLYDRRRREAFKGHMDRFQDGARQRYSDLGGVAGAVDRVRGRSSSGSVALDEAALEARVREAVAGGGPAPDGLKVTVEGRTVYLRGAVESASAVDEAAERVHAVDGVVAVVNLTTSPAATATRNGGA